MNFSAITRRRVAMRVCKAGRQLSNKSIILKFMRISFAVIFITMLSVQLLSAAVSSAQDMHTEKVTIALKRESLETAIHKIEQQTALRFYYRKADIRHINNLYLPETASSVEQILQALLQNTFISFRQVDQNILLQKNQFQIPYEIKGRVVGIDHKPVEFAVVSVSEKVANKTLQTTQTDTGGYFKLSVMAKGDYLVKLSAMGKDSLSVAVTLADAPVITLPDLVLSTAVRQLKQVSIVSTRPFIEQKLDRTVVNVDALIGNAGVTALEVLEKSPGVQIDQSGKISLKGKSGVTVFIDNKPTYLSGEDLQNYLRSLPSSTLDQIEIMTNPPAQYDAAGNGGVINIKTKKNTAKGFNGGISLAYIQGKYAKTNNSFNFNYRDGKLNIFGNLGFNIQRGFNNLYIDRQYFTPDGSTTSFLNQHTYIYQHGQATSSKLGADYYASDKTTFGVVLMGSIRPYARDYNSTSNLLGATRQLDSAVVALNTEKYNNKNGGINFNFRHEYDKSGKELTADVDYIVYQSKINQQFNNFTYLPDQSLATQDQQVGYLPATVHIYSAKTDYAHPFANKLKLMAGLKSSFTKTDNLADYANVINQVSNPDYNLSNHFIYKENINAAYINVNKDFNKLSIQAGLRFENTNSDGHQLGNAQSPDSAFQRNYNSLFPTFYASYKLDTMSNNQFGLKIGRRIDRPYYQDLNPFISPIDKFTYYLGNPLLKPSYSTEFELSHTYKNKFTTAISYGTTTDNVNETIEIINGIYYDRPGNIGTSTYKSISIDGTLDPTKWLSFHLYSELTQTESKSAFYNGYLHTKGTFVYVNPMLQFKIGSTWNAQLDGSYRSKLTSAQFILGSRGQVNMAVSKKLSTSTSLKLAVNDIFYSTVNQGIISNLVNTNASYRNKNDTQYGVLTFSYRFGKTISDQRKHDANGAESEQNRVKN